MATSSGSQQDDAQRSLVRPMPSLGAVTPPTPVTAPSITTASPWQTPMPTLIPPSLPYDNPFLHTRPPATQSLFPPPLITLTTAGTPTSTPVPASFLPPFPPLFASGTPSTPTPTPTVPQSFFISTSNPPVQFTPPPFYVNSFLTAPIINTPYMTPQYPFVPFYQSFQPQTLNPIPTITTPPSPFVKELLDYEIPSTAKLPTLKVYNGTTCPDNHIDTYEWHMTSLKLDQRFWCTYFPTTLDGNAGAWFKILAPNSIYNFEQLKQLFLTNFMQLRKYRGDN
ncbi:hypothetical protein L2E82_08283 [Cichorium intybus]|uniref:Uncharacterized protein n=1 Tax=Cichorium intybus TaxID=13427 RepID=A0ACB9G648_CICIN|nr:hypothetical protein L2E82_08283 [Cichorium intybus]